MELIIREQESVHIKTEQNIKEIPRELTIRDQESVYIETELENKKSPREILSMSRKSSNSSQSSRSHSRQASWGFGVSNSVSPKSLDNSFVQI
eukprot:UN05398